MILIPRPRFLLCVSSARGLVDWCCVRAKSVSQGCWLCLELCFALLCIRWGIMNHNADQSLGLGMDAGLHLWAPGREKRSGKGGRCLLWLCFYGNESRAKTQAMRWRSFCLFRPVPSSFAPHPVFTFVSRFQRARLLLMYVRQLPVGKVKRLSQMYWLRCLYAPSQTSCSVG